MSINPVGPERPDPDDPNTIWVKCEDGQGRPNGWIPIVRVHMTEEELVDAPKPNTEFVAQVIRDDTHKPTPPATIPYHLTLRGNWEAKLERHRKRLKKWIEERKISPLDYDREMNEYIKDHYPCPKCGLPTVNLAHRGCRPIPCECGWDSSPTFLR